MLSGSQKNILIKFFSMFSVVRGYNILIVVFAQYVASIFIMAKNKPLRAVIFDVNLFLLVLASAATIAAGYIINNFYDSEKDLINKPQKTLLDRLVSQNTKLSFYFVLNFFAVIMASYVSFNAVLFFSFYIFAIWLYSHKLKKILVLGNITSSILAVFPFFCIFLYYKNFDIVIYIHALFLVLVISMRELIKDLENLKGDMALNYQTIPIVYGTKTSKIMITLLSIFTLIPIALLVSKYRYGYMHFYFMLSVVLLVVFEVLLWRSSKKKQYIMLHNILKVVIVTGVFSIPLLDVNLITSKLPL